MAKKNEIAKADSTQLQPLENIENLIHGIRVKQGEPLLVPASENVLYIFGNATFLTATM